MSLLKKYACLYEDMEFTHQEEEDLGRFAMALIKAASAHDQERLNALFVHELHNITDNGFTRIAGILEHFSALEKTAAFGDSLGQALSTAAIPISLGLAAAPLVIGGIRHLMQGSAISASLKKIYQLHPELKNDPNVPMYFQTIVDFAPAVAANPLVSGNLLAQWHAAGPSMAQAEIIKMLVGIQKDVSERQRLGTGGAAGELGRHSLTSALAGAREPWKG
jgi:hypothetical protein